LVSINTIKQSLAWEGKLLLANRFLRWLDNKQIVDPSFNLTHKELSKWLIDNGYPESYVEDVWGIVEDKLSCLEPA
jgi:hypothetical protein